jgi:hypothetical protein
VTCLSRLFLGHGDFCFWKSYDENKSAIHVPSPSLCDGAYRPVAHRMCRATVSAPVHAAEKTKAVAGIPWQTGGTAGGRHTAESVIRSAGDGSRATASHLCVASMIYLPNCFLMRCGFTTGAPHNERPVPRGR